MKSFMKRPMMSVLAAVPLAGILLAGCLSPREITPIQLYTLDPPIAVQEFAPSQQTLGLRPVEAAEPFNQKMAYLSGAHQLGFRFMDQWAALPGNVVTRAVEDAIDGAGYFVDAGNAVHMAHPDLMLTGTLRKFYEDRTTSPATATLEVSFELRESRGTDQLLSEILRIREPMAGDTAADFAAAMNTAIGKLATATAERVIEAAQKNAEESPASAL